MSSNPRIPWYQKARRRPDNRRADRQLAAAQTALAQSDIFLSADLVAVYKALGGGWE